MRAGRAHLTKCEAELSALGPARQSQVPGSCHRTAGTEAANTALPPEPRPDSPTTESRESLVNAHWDWT